jgi:predicted amidohydrolase
MKAAAIQMVSGASLDANLRAAHALLREAAQQGAELAVLPEYFCLMGHQDTDKLAVREPPGSGTVQAFLASTARELGLWLVGGTLPHGGQ